jgi:hypothetical protein
VGRRTEAGKTALKREVVRSVDVTLLYFDDCPNWQLADQRLREALALAGRDDVQVERPSGCHPRAGRGRRIPRVPDGADQRSGPVRQPGRPGRPVLPGVRHATGLTGAPTVEQLLAVLS